MGHVHGTFYVTTRPSEDAGVHVYVNGRRIGDPKTLLHGSKLQNRIVGIVQANELEPAILFDRGRFKEDNPGVKEAYKVLRKFIGRIDTDIRKDIRDRHYKVAKREATEALSEVVSILKNKLGQSLRVQVGEIAGDDVARYSPSTGITLNGKHPQFRVTDEFDAGVYRAAVFDAIIDVLTVRQVGQKASIAHFLERKQNIVQRIYEQSGTAQRVQREISAKAPATPAERTFSDIRMYETADIANMSGLMDGTINRFQEAGVLYFKGDKAKGEQINAVLKEIDGYTPLFEIVRKALGPTNITSLYSTASRKFKEASSDVPYLKDIGDKKPCILVKTEFVDGVKKIFSKPLGKKKITDALQAVADRQLPLQGLAQHLGISIEETRKIIAYADSNSIHIGEKDNGAKTYNYFYVAQAYQRMRKGERPTSTREVTAEPTGSTSPMEFDFRDIGKD